MTNELKERLSKIYELVKRGDTEGEREAAKLALDRLMLKYNLKNIDFDNLDQMAYHFKYVNNLDLKLMGAIISYFIDEKVKASKHTYARTNKGIVRVKNIVINLTYQQYVTIDCAYEYFRRHMNEQFKKYCGDDIKRKRTDKTKKKRREELQNVFFSRYVIASNLYRGKDIKTLDVKSMSNKEYADRLRMADKVEGGKYNVQVHTANLLNK